MKVRATQMGYYDDLREPGEEFELKSVDHFSKKWMEKVETKQPKKTSNE